MTNFSTKDIRNIALIGHSGEGKTTLAEAILFNAKSIDRTGRVEDGNTVMDFDAEEIARKISISLSAAYAVYRGVKINLLDVPGFFDFEGEKASAMRVAGSAVIVTAASGQLTVGTELALDLCYEKKMPAIIFVSHIDKENSNFKETVKAIQAKYSHVGVLEYPVMTDGKMTGYIDIPTQKAYDNGGNEIAFPENLRTEAKEIYDKFIETVAESSDELIEKFFAGEPFTEEEIKNGTKEGIKSGLLVPVFAGCSVKNVGVLSLMDKIVDVFPAPDERKVSTAADENGEDTVVKCDASAPFSAQVFKTVVDPFVGKLLYFKVMSGKISAGETVYNSSAGKNEKIGALYVLKGKKQESADSLSAGDIGAVAKLVYTNIGDTLCDPIRKLVFPPIEFPSPMISLAVTSAKQGDEEKVIQGLMRFLEEDCTVKINKNVETGDVELFGMGETQLEIICKKLKNKFGAEAKLTNPKVPYRETIKKTVQVQGKHKKQSGGHGQYGDCWIRFEPYPDGDFLFEEEVVGGSVPKQYHPAVEKGLRECLANGVLAGYPVVNIKAVLYDGSYHDVDSSEMAFKIAAHNAFKDGCEKANPALLEPIMKVEITVPDSYIGDIISDINKRRGRIHGTDVLKGKQVITAEVPQHEMFKYATDLRSMTQGRGRFSAAFERYEEAPPAVAQKIIDDAKKAAEAAGK
ncbi:MAG: elongation factor G [Clostridiales bacterium]|jgi:elongation factor G|nr:elongation factor G [Clostridiales bacterium]MDR2090966.1 elongation factor G [Clostridiales bacterium]